jgi:inositol-hexakisphosphate kinase
MASPQDAPVTDQPLLVRQKSEKAKGKERERERPALDRQSMNATVSLRPIGGSFSDERKVTSKDYATQAPAASATLIPGLFQRTTSAASSTTTGSSILPPSPTASTSQLAPTTTPRRRQRSNSILFPLEAHRSPSHASTLAHFSTDSKFSLSHDIDRDLDLALCNDFDASFGEVMRRGAGGREIALPSHAVRVLSEAKEQSDIRVLGKTGRKGSLGMGLFRESRDAAVAAAAQAQALGLGQDDRHPIEEEESDLEPDPEFDDHSAVHKAASAIRDIKHDLREKVKQWTSKAPLHPHSESPKRRSKSRSVGVTTPTEPPQFPLAHTPTSSEHPDDESGWTSDTDDFESPSIASASGSGTEPDDDWPHSHDASDQSDDDERERMTVPLQPFSHAVGGHSSIYKFTRRAVCKVSLFPICK